jgi:predicted deacylase
MARNSLSSDSTEFEVDRRTYLKSGIFALGSVGGLTAGSRGVSAGSGRTSRSSYSIMDGTAEETTVYEIDSGNPGPTVLLTGGIHGNEANGYKSAEVIINWDIDAGRLVVIPRCNRKGIRRDSRTYDNRNKRNIDLNRQFPPGETPTTPLARAIWNVAVSEDIDFLIDMHSSHGIYKQGSGVGQGIFSTAAGNATAYRKRLVSYMNENVITDSTFAFSGATSPDGSRPMLKHKVGTDLNTPAMIIESTYEYDRSIATQVQNTTTVVREFLREYGLITRSHDAAADNALLYHDDTAAVDALVDDNGERSGLTFTITNDADSSMRIRDVRIEPANDDVDGLSDHSYSEGKWVSELFIDADVQNGVTDINNGMSLPGSIDLDTDGFSDGASTEAVLSSDSSATINLYQFRASGSPVDMAGKAVEVGIEYSVNDSGKSRTITLRP